MKASEIKKSLTQIIRNLEARSEKMSATYKRRREAHNIAVKLLREIKREEKSLKSIKWRMAKSGIEGVQRWEWKRYIITRGESGADVWLGTQNVFGDVHGIGWFDDIEEAKEVVQLISGNKTRNKYE